MMFNEQSLDLCTPYIPNPVLRIYLLGPLRIERDTIPVRLPRRKVEALLAYLLLHREPHSRDALATLFWGDTPDEKARHSLRTALATVRQYLGEDLLIANREQVQLNPDFPIWVDLQELLDLGKNLDRLDLSQPGVLDTILALWQAELLEGIYEDWVTAEREHYRARLIKLFLKLTHLLRSQSEYGQAIKVAKQILRFEPANEAAHQHLMFCYMAIGERSAALRQYELCEQALRNDLDAPPLAETTALYHWIKQQDEAASSIIAKITNLPIPLTSFVGRTQPMSEVKRLLNPDGTHTRLLTLTGAGGSGKTRLAIQVATDLIDRFAQGVWWVELSALTEGGQIAQAVAKSLGVSEVRNEPCLRSVINFLADKQLLLVLDNCEHLIEPSAEVTAELLQHCPNLQIMTTSRESLNVAGEVLWQVPTLALPEPQQVSLLDLLLQHECIRLFYERASAVQPGFRLTLENASAVVELCARLDGIPLAIELAAARVKVLPVEQIAARLSSAVGARFDLLTHGSRTVQPRQQTLRAAIDWSYDLLDEDERRLFRTVAIFRGGFSLDALEKIAALYAEGDRVKIRNPQSAIRNPLDLLTQLVDKSLVVVEPQAGQNRYRMLETLREYALDCFADPEELQRIERCHAEFFVKWAEQASPQLITSQQQEWLNLFEVEQPNLRAALEFLIANDTHELALILAIAANRFWDIRGYVEEGRRWFKKMLAERAGISLETQASALNCAGFLAFRQSDFDEAMALFNQSLELFQAIKSETGMAEVWQNMAACEMRQGQFALAQHYLQQSLEMSRSAKYDYGIARALQYLTVLCYDQDQFIEARDYAVESLAYYRVLGDQVSITNLLFNLGNVLRAMGEVQTARTYHEECLAMSRRIGHKGLTGAALRSLGRMLMDAKEFVQANHYAEESLRIFQQLGDTSNIGFGIVLLGDLTHRRGEIAKSHGHYAQALQIFAEQNYKWPIYNTLECIAHLLIGSNQYSEAATRLLSAALVVRQEIGNGVTASEQEEYNQYLAKLRRQLSDSDFERFWQQGQSMPLAQIVSEVCAIALP